MKEYDQLAKSGWYAANRDPNIGIADISLLVKELPRNSRVLDLGCGNGFPITQFLFDAGLNVFGIDSSSPMIAQLANRNPKIRVQCDDLFNSDFFNLNFDAIIAYGLIFHFPREQQIKLIQKAAGHLKPNGKFLFNSGIKIGRAVSTMDGINIPQWSLSADLYATALEDNGLKLIANYPDKQSGTYIYISKKI